MSTMETGVPDLLRRFAPAPHSTKVLINNIEVELHTDDVEIVARMQPKNGDTADPRSRISLLAKIVRDYGAPLIGSTVTIISAPPLTALLVGTGTALVLDSELCEILGFLASSVSAEQFVNELLPTLLDRLKGLVAASE